MDLSEPDQRARRRRVSRLLRELASRDVDRLLIGLELALEDGPVTVVLVREERSSGWPRRTCSVSRRVRKSRSPALRRADREAALGIVG
jgi:hypothetical protein